MATTHTEIDWRSWVNFVFLNGGVPEGSDGELRRRACENVFTEWEVRRLMSLSMAEEEASQSHATSTRGINRDRQDIITRLIREHRAQRSVE